MKINLIQKARLVMQQIDTALTTNCSKLYMNDKTQIATFYINDSEFTEKYEVTYSHLKRMNEIELNHVVIEMLKDFLSTKIKCNF